MTSFERGDKVTCNINGKLVYRYIVDIGVQRGVPYYALSWRRGGAISAMTLSNSFLESEDSLFDKRTGRRKRT